MDPTKLTQTAGRIQHQSMPLVHKYPHIRTKGGNAYALFCN